MVDTWAKFKKCHQMVKYVLNDDDDDDEISQYRKPRLDIVITVLSSIDLR